MIRNTLTSLAIVAGCAVALALPAVQAQTVDTQILMNAQRVNPGDCADGMAGGNNVESAQYDGLVQKRAGFLQARILKNCGLITDPTLRASCLSAAEDRYFVNTQKALSGGSNGTMTTTALDR